MKKLIGFILLLGLGFCAYPPINTDATISNAEWQALRQTLVSGNYDVRFLSVTVNSGVSANAVNVSGALTANKLVAGSGGGVVGVNPAPSNWGGTEKGYIFRVGSSNNDYVGLLVSNTNSGASARAMLSAFTDTEQHGLNMVMYGVNNTQSSWKNNTGALLGESQINRLVIGNNGIAPINFSVNDVIIATISSQGLVVNAGDNTASKSMSIGSASIPDKFVIYADGTVSANNLKLSGTFTGTSISGSSLVVNASGAGGIDLFRAGASNSSIKISNGVGSYYTGLGANGFYTFGANADLATNPQVTIVSSNGNVGIGTTAPSTKLEVNGTVSMNYTIGSGGTVTPSAVEGSTWYNRTSKKMNYYNGTTWISF